MEESCPDDQHLATASKRYIHFGSIDRLETRRPDPFAPVDDPDWWEGFWIISSGSDNRGLFPEASASLLFESGNRPGKSDLSGLSARLPAAFSISHDPADPAEGLLEGRTSRDHAWLELLRDGLSFDLSGLAPGAGLDPLSIVQQIGFQPDIVLPKMEAVQLVPGPHLSGGTRLLPVLRSLAGLAADLSQLDGCIGVCWDAARCLSTPDHFSALTQRWLNGGVLPGIGLASLIVAPDGGMQSIGLALFTGQEIRIEPDLTDSKPAAARLALRLLDELADKDPVDKKLRFTGPDGQDLRLEPSPNGRYVRVWKA